MKTHFGPLLLVEMPEAIWSASFERLLARYEPAGVLFRSLATLAAAREAARESARALASVPFLAIEEEGRGALCGLFAARPHAEQLSSNSAERMSDLIGRAMALIGLNLNLAPTVDLPKAAEACDDGLAGIKVTAVTKRAEGFVRGLARHHVLCCARHFPGLATLPGETACAAPMVAKSMSALWREDLAPYRTLGKKLPLVEVSHAAYKAYDYEFPRPASLSPIVVEGLLRLKLGYEGVALADAPAAARAARIEVGEAAVRALAAGCDLVLVPGEGQPLEAVLSALERAVESGKLPRQRVERALERMKKAKGGLTIPRRRPSERDLARLADDFEECAKQCAAEERNVD